MASKASSSEVEEDHALVQARRIQQSMRKVMAHYSAQMRNIHEEVKSQLVMSSEQFEKAYSNEATSVMHIEEQVMKKRF
jgi:hypothetical protein